MSAYDYPDTPHERRHGPQGYTDYTSYKPWLRDDFTFRCVYCLNRERWFPLGADAFGVDHVIAQASDPDRVLDYDNLVYACARCNSYKQESALLNPCQFALSQHVRIKEDGAIEALTDEGRECVRILALDRPALTAFRLRLIRTLNIMSRSDDPEAQRWATEWLGYPQDLPDLSRLRPTSNTRPDGIGQSHYTRRTKGELPDSY